MNHVRRLLTLEERIDDVIDTLLDMRRLRVDIDTAAILRIAVAGADRRIAQLERDMNAPGAKVIAFPQRGRHAR